MVVGIAIIDKHGRTAADVLFLRAPAMLIKVLMYETQGEYL
jgi:hypothetical protein